MSEFERLLTPKTFSAFESFSDAWGLVQGKYLMLLLTSFVYLIISVVSQNLPYANIIFYFFLLPPLTAGFCSVFIGAVDEDHADIGKLFSGFSRYGTCLLASLIIFLPYVLFVGLVWIIVALSIGEATSQNQNQVFTWLMIPLWVIMMLTYIIWGTSTFFTYYLIMDKGLGAWSAVTTSTKAALRNFGQMIMMFILFGITNLIGLLLLCIGLLFVFPITQLFAAYCYRSMFPREVDPELDLAPPSPDDYAGMFQ